MIINTVCSVTHTTIADQYAWYSVPFTYITVLNIPQIIVTLDGVELVYTTDYTLGSSGLQLTSEPEAGKALVITRNTPMTQTTDFQTGMIDPDEIEHALDIAAMRDQELDYKITKTTTYSKAIVVLTAAGWVENTQTLSIENVTVDNTVMYSPNPDSLEEYSMNGVKCVDQQDGYLTFTCETTPSSDITLNMVFMG